MAKARGSTITFDYDLKATHTSYMSVNAGGSISEDTNPTTLYFRSTTAGAVIEIEEWE